MLLGLPLDKCSGLPRTADYTFNMSHATEDANRLVFIPLSVSRQWRTEGGVWGCSTPPPKFRRYRWSPRSHEQEEPASRFPFV